MNFSSEAIVYLCSNPLFISAFIITFKNYLKNHQEHMRYLSLAWFSVLIWNITQTWAIILLSETMSSQMHVGIKGSKEIIKILNKKYNFKIDYTKVDSVAATIILEEFLNS